MIRSLPLLILAGCISQPAQQQSVSPLFDRASILALLQPCPIEQPKRYTAAEATRVANARRDALIACNKDKEALRAKLQ